MIKDKYNIPLFVGANVECINGEAAPYKDAIWYKGTIRKIELSRDIKDYYTIIIDIEDIGIWCEWYYYLKKKTDRIKLIK